MAQNATIKIDMSDCSLLPWVPVGALTTASQLLHNNCTILKHSMSGMASAP
jgi:hypothetical protein